MESPDRTHVRRFDVPGDAHFLTFSCFRQLPLLSRPRTCQFLIDAIQISREKNPFDLWAFVIMPEHVHLIVLPRENIKIAAILSSIKQSAAKRAIRWLELNAAHFLPRIEDCQPSGKSSYRFWQRGGGYDRNLRSTRDAHEKVRYIHENPVRRGLVQRAIDWPWSSCAAWEHGVDLPLRIDRESVPMVTNFDESIDSDLWR